MSDSANSTRVAMRLSEKEIDLIKRLREDMKLSTNTGTIEQSLRIADLVVSGIKQGKQLAFVDSKGNINSRLVIPGLSQSF